MLCISVTDQGKGIPSALLTDLFKPFVTTKESGTGLGLANVKKIAQLHGGTVHAENLTTGGARFTLCITLKGETS